MNYLLLLLQITVGMCPETAFPDQGKTASAAIGNYSYINQTSPPKDDILFHEHQLLTNEPVLTKELKELQEQKELEHQYQRIASKLSADQQALLHLHTGIQPIPPNYQDDIYCGTTGALGGSYGRSGLVGDKGYGMGTTGHAGTHGYPNSTGLMGTHGYSSSTGLMGTQGYSSSTGLMGTQGYSGTTGLNCGQNYSGVQNYPGQQNYAGSSCLNAPMRYPGNAGLAESQMYPAGGYQKTGPLGGVTPALGVNNPSYGGAYGSTGQNYSNTGYSQDPAQFLQPGLEGDSHSTNPRYSPPVKRFLLTRDPKDRRTAGNGLGMKVLGGKEIPGSKGRVCGFVSKILPSGVVDNLREVHEGDMVLEWNGIPLMDRTDSEVQRILDQSAQEPEVEILIRNDVNMLTGKRLPNSQGKVVDLSGFRDQDWYSPGKGEPYYREYPPRDQRLGYDINGNKYNQSATTYHQQGGIRDPYGGQYSAVKTTDALGRQLPVGEYGYDKQSSNQLRDGFYNYQTARDKNYNQSSRYGTNLYRDDLSYPRDRRFTDDLRNPVSPFGRYRNHNNNKNDPGWRDPSQDRRRRREQDRYYAGDRELPPTPNMTRRHSWDAYDESGYARGQYWRSRYNYTDREDDLYKKTEGDFLRTRHHSDPSFRTDYQGVRRWHSTDRYPEEYRNRYLPDIRTSRHTADDPRTSRHTADDPRTSRHTADDPRERRYGSAQYLDYSSRRYREEFEYARKDLDRFQRYGSFKDYGNQYREDRYKTDKYRDGIDYYRDSKQYPEDSRYLQSVDKYRDSKDPYLQADRYKDTRSSTDRYRDDDRYRDPQQQGLSRWGDQRDPYDTSARYQQDPLNQGYVDDRHRDPYDTRARDGTERYADDRYYDSTASATTYRNQGVDSSASAATYRNQGVADPNRDPQGGYTSAQYRDDREYQDRYRDSRHQGYEYDTSAERDRKHRSRNPPQQLNLEGRAVPASPSTGKRDDPRSRERKSHKNNSKDTKSRKSKRHHQSQQVQQAEVQLLICHDIVAQILYVTVLRARNLFTLREDGDTRPDPFIKVYLLPGRSLENQRRTRHFNRTSSPEWNQTMVYPNLQASDLKKRYLEVTAWNYDQHRPNEFLGEVVLDLSDTTVVDEEPKWYTLQEMVDRSEMPVNVLGSNARL